MIPASPKATPGAAGIAADDPSVRVGIEMPASLLSRLRDHARATKSSVSRLCRDGALSELLRAKDGTS